MTPRILPSAGSARAAAHANIAFIKYWGNRDEVLRLPTNDSLSMNLSAALTTTEMRWTGAPGPDHLVLQGAEQAGAALARVSRHLDALRARWGAQLGAALVLSENTFPMGTGIASSASAFAALTVAAAAAAGVNESEAALSALARLGSGSAARSVPGGFVRWHAGPTHDRSFAESIAPPGHWDLADVVAVVSREHKAVGSTGGHAAAIASPYFEARLAELPARTAIVERALGERHLGLLGPAIEAEAISLHVIALTGRPSVLYWLPGTVALLLQVPRWRADGLPVYFTLDAGPNVHLICESRDAEAVARELAAFAGVESVFVNHPAGPAHILPVAEALGSRFAEASEPNSPARLSFRQGS